MAGLTPGDLFAERQAPRWTAYVEQRYQQMVDAERTIDQFPKYYRACARNFHLTGMQECDRLSEPTTRINHG